jgi:outer membrane protein TolC
LDQRLTGLLRRQIASGFQDLRGAEATVTLPVSDRLLNEFITEAMPASAAVRDLEVRAQEGNRFAVRARLGRASFLPPITLTIAIDRQPELPGSPVLVLRLERGGLLSLAGPALRFFDALPQGIRIEQDRIHIDLVRLLEPRGFSGFLEHIDQLHVGTAPGTTIVSTRARIR